VFLDNKAFCAVLCGTQWWSHVFFIFSVRLLSEMLETCVLTK